MMKNIPELIGQERIKAFLDNSIQKKRIPHAIIISGETGSGKSEIAISYAAAILGSTEQSPNINIIDLSLPKISFIEIIREELIKKIDLAPLGEEYKIFIIKGAGRMSIEAQNSLLKSLEEPPEYAVIIILTDNLGKLLPTIRSRSSKLQIAPVPRGTLIDYLISCGADKRGASLCTDLCRGNLVKARTLIQDEEGIEIALKTIEVVTKVAAGEPTVNFLQEKKLFVENIDKFLEYVEIILRDVLVYKLLQDSSKITILDWSSQIKTIANKCSEETLGSIRRQIVCTRESNAANVISAVKESMIDLLLIEIGGNT